MQVHFVRHGETCLNKKHVHQIPSTPLSDDGRLEIINTVDILRSKSPDFLISSDYTRAMETARIIEMNLKLTPEPNQTFCEIIRPSSLYGKSHFSLETFKYVISSVWHRSNKDWHYKDSENMNDLIVRTRDAFTYLEKLSVKYESIVVVSHSVFINFMVAHMCNRKKLSFFKLLFAFLKIKQTKNGEIVSLEYLGKQKDKNICSWRRIS